MSVHVARKLLAALLFFSPLLSCAAQKPLDKTKRVPKTVWNFEGGVFLQTDGNLSEETCFRLSGRVTAKGFFDNLKRVDDDEGTRFLRGQEAITEFPELVKLMFVIRDFPCTANLNGGVGRQYLTREMMSKLKLSLFWKRGVALRPIDDFKVTFAAVKQIPPYATELASELHEKLEWMYELDIPSQGVPLTDGLVLIFRREDGRIAARVAARL
jgi:hypothetical protein